MRLNDQLESTDGVPHRGRRVAQLARRHRQRRWARSATRPARPRAHAAGGQRLDLRAGRQSIKQEIDQLTEQAKTTLNSAFDGRYLFSGTATDTAPYSAATGDAYQGDAAPVVRQIGPGVSVQVNVTGDDVLAGLLPTLRTLSAHLASNDIASLGTSDLQAIDAGVDNLTAKRGAGRRHHQPRRRGRQRLDDTTDVTTAFLSKTQDADLPQALTDLSAQQNALQAALRGGATLIQQSLMDFLR